MNRSSTLILASLLLGATACDKAEQPAAKQAQADAPVPAEPEVEAPAPAEAPAATVASGLAPGMRFAAFEILNCETGDQYCQVCKYGPNPKIMAVGTIDDADFQEDLEQLDALVAKLGNDRVKAFAVIAEEKDGALVTPVADKDALLAKAKAMREELGISMPVVLPAPKGDGQNGTFEDHYKISKSRTIMFADGKNEVHYSEVAPSDYAGLETKIGEVVG
ncbi:hypothetical protein G6O69_25930 [Pseudenhygromyxa sp. WMMC2535]|uniref:hypothetical protein n=1 Tax=Pseudenhygromyxa sp. WMMC2535 TaxID=2712867 RepID=UPI001553A943|nr:hypothetical protein [Pseudenhygromyxa sp. WMMC2535]NVB41304.1 hypothetical protein [Pseudenhygromyxa sp. WMMC2535]